VLSFLDRHLKESSYAPADPYLLKSNSWNITGKKKIEPPPTEEEFIEIIRNEGVDKACRIFNEARQQDSSACFFGEKTILNYAIAWGPERADDLIRLLEINLEAYPRSSESYFWLGQCYLSKDNHDKAVEYFNETLKIDPAHEKARKILSKCN
jgi:tetratricopeptide (TPR) repeat protein